MIEAKNVVIYMSDSVRWDSCPEEILDMGVGLRTISASSHTPTSIASMLTGQYLPHHGVRGFTDAIPEQVPSILDQFDAHGLSDIGGEFNDDHLGQFFNETVYDNVLNQYPRISLSEIDPPFCWFMRDPGGHAPYGNWDKEMNALTTVPDFYDYHAGDTEELYMRYQEGINSSVDRFQRHVLKPLREQGLLEDTLIVFLSDHGELLGEYGHVSQSYPVCPEVVYVPTVYIHPNLPNSEAEITSHVDVPKTIAHLLGIDAFHDTPGESVFKTQYNRSTGYCFYNRTFPSFRGEFNYRIDSMWDADGGHVFVRSNAWDCTKLLLGYLTKISAGKHLKRSRNPHGFRLLFSSQETWGTPNFSVEQANRELKDARKQTIEKPGRSMSDNAEDRLKDLGYL